MTPRILIIEDEPAIADTLVYALKTDGFETVWCETGEAGMAALQAGGINLIILDVGLPDRNGFELCRDIRKSSAVPIIFLTSRTAEVDRVVGLEIGGDDYVTKPFSPREVSARVKAVLRRTPEAGHALPSDSPFFVDRPRARILFFGKPLDLSRYEFRLLEVLIGRPGWVFSRDQLMEQAWQEPEASMDRTVDTHIKTLRAKLKKLKPGLDPILTHRGTGYSLRDSW